MISCRAQDLIEEERDETAVADIDVAVYAGPDLEDVEDFAFVERGGGDGAEGLPG
jgi:hypothetical protein